MSRFLPRILLLWLLRLHVPVVPPVSAAFFPLQADDACDTTDLLSGVILQRKNDFVQAVADRRLSHARALAQSIAELLQQQQQRNKRNDVFRTSTTTLQQCIRSLQDIFQQSSSPPDNSDHRDSYNYNDHREETTDFWPTDLRPRVPPSTEEEDAPCWAWQLEEVGAATNHSLPLASPPQQQRRRRYLNEDLWDTCCNVAAVLPPSSSSSIQEDVSIQPTAAAVLPDNDASTDPSCRNTQGQSYCCTLTPGTSVYLFLPMLHTMAFRLVVPTDTNNNDTMNQDETGDDRITTSYTLDVEQDGFLRPYDTAAVMWPTAYLLSLCLGAPRRCGIDHELNEAIRYHDHAYNPPSPNSSSDSSSNSNTRRTRTEIRPLSIELGAGLGIPSIVFALTRRRANVPPSKIAVVTDKSRVALDLVHDNARAAHQLDALEVQPLDFFNLTAVAQFAQDYYHDDGHGFPLVFGSSLMALFDPLESDQLFAVLDALLDRDNPHALALLAHSVDTFQMPSTMTQAWWWERIHVISGHAFGMTTRHPTDPATTSSFEISVLRRRRRRRRRRSVPDSLVPPPRSEL